MGRLILFIIGSICLSEVLAKIDYLASVFCSGNIILLVQVRQLFMIGSCDNNGSQTFVVRWLECKKCNLTDGRGGGG